MKFRSDIYKTINSDIIKSIIIIIIIKVVEIRKAKYLWGSLRTVRLTSFVVGYKAELCTIKQKRRVGQHSSGTTYIVIYTTSLAYMNYALSIKKK
jgi:hypothetical protein